MQGEFTRYDGELLHNTTTHTSAVYLPALQVPPQVPLGVSLDGITEIGSNLWRIFGGISREDVLMDAIRGYDCNSNWYDQYASEDTLIFMFIETPPAANDGQYALQYTHVYCMSDKLLDHLSSLVDWKRFHNTTTSDNDVDLIEFVKPFCVKSSVIQYRDMTDATQTNVRYENITSVVVQCILSSMAGEMHTLQTRLIALDKHTLIDPTDESKLQDFAVMASIQFKKQLDLCVNEFSSFLSVSLSVYEPAGVLHHLRKYILSYQPPQTVLILFQHKALQADHLYANLLQGAASNGLDMRTIWVPNNEFEHTNMDAASFASLVWKTLAEKQPELLQSSFSDQPVANSGFGMGTVGIPYQRYESTLAEATRQMKAIKNIMYDAWQKSSEFRVSNIVVMSETYILRRLQADGVLHSIFANRDMLEVIFVFRRRPELRYAFSAAVGKRLLSETLVTRAKRSQMEHSRAVAWAEKEYYALYQLVKNTRLPTLPEKLEKEQLNEKANDSLYELDESWIWTDYANQLCGTATLDSVTESQKTIDRWKKSRTIY
jgi:hypothetical protein